MQDIPVLTPEKIITTIKNKKTGEIYETEEALKAANIPAEEADAQYGDPPKSSPLMRGRSRGEALRQADEERIAIEERRAKQWEGRSKVRRGGTS